jgi:hypothetical protein
MRQPWRTTVLGPSVAVGAIMTLLPAVVHACAVCVGSEDDGYFWGVLFLMAMPFIVGSSIGGWLLYSYRRAQPGLAPSASHPIVERHRDRPASMSTVAEGRNEEAQVHHT